MACDDRRTMKPIARLRLIALTLALESASAQPPATDEKPSLAQQQAAIRAAAIAFSTELRREPTYGLPTDAQLQRLSAHLTPELHDLIKIARSIQQEQIRKHPDEKPYWIEDDLFSSLSEGVTSWELGDVFNAPTGDATVEVKQTYTEPNQKPLTWTDTLVFKQRGQRWLLDDVRMGGDWLSEHDYSLRRSLPGGHKELQDHDSLNERWRIAFTREDERVTRVTIQPKDRSSKPMTLFGGGEFDACIMPTWIVWSPNDDKFALRLGDGHRYTRTLIFRLVGKAWKSVPMPEFYPKEKKAMLSHGFRERYCLIDAEHWQDADTLVVRYFGSFENGDDGDGYSKFISVRIDAKGNSEVIGAVDVPGEN